MAKLTNVRYAERNINYIINTRDNLQQRKHVILLHIVVYYENISWKEVPTWRNQKKWRYQELLLYLLSVQKLKKKAFYELLF
jgi:hypothetical protein